MQKRGQITLFIIIGILMVAVFSSLYYLSSLSQEAAQQEESQKAASALFSQQQFDYYINLCLQDAFENSLKLISSQGGKIYTDQKGSILRVNGSRQNYDGVYVANAILNALVSPPQYPCKSSFPNYDVGPQFCGFINSPLFSYLNETEYGRLVNKPLCASGNPTTSSLCAASQGSQSLQEQMESYIESSVAGCVDFSQIDGFGTTFTAKFGNLNADISFEERGTQVSLDFPINITISGQEPAVRLFRFNSFLPIRLGPLYLFVLDQIHSEVKNLTFDSTADVNINNYHPEFIINKIPVSNNNYILQFVDTSPDHLFMGKNFTLQIGVLNRPPALDYLSDTRPYNPSLQNSSMLSRVFDYYILEGETLTLNPNASDPDSDIVSYYYSGWKEDYDEAINESCASKILLSGADGLTDANNLYDNLVKKCITKLKKKPHNWTLSTLYVQTNQSANYTAQRGDIGPHEVIINASDGAAADYQQVQILVVDKVHPRAAGRNYISGVADNIASVEDPYIINASANTIFRPPTAPALTIRWFDLYDGKSWEFTPSNNLSFVLSKNYSETPVSNKINPFNFSSTGIHTLVMNVNVSATSTMPAYSENYTFKVNVTPCLPYSKPSEDNANESRFKNYPYNLPPPFPYNNLTFDNDIYPNESEDPYYAVHICCNGAINTTGQLTTSPVDTGKPGTLAASNTCYNYTKYGCYNNINASFDTFQKLNKTAAPYAISSISIISENLSTPALYEASLVATCGLRGNACDGPTKLKLVVADNFSELNDGNPELCGGCIPGGPFINISDSFVNTTTLYDKNKNKSPGDENFYTYESYLNETLGLFPDATGVCNKGARPSVGFGDGNYSKRESGNTYYLCESTCGSSGCDFAINCVCGPGDENSDGTVNYNLNETDGSPSCKEEKLADIQSGSSRCNATCEPTKP